MLVSTCPFGLDPICCNRTLPIPNSDFDACFRFTLKQQGVQGEEFTNPTFDSAGNLKTLMVVAETSYKFSDVFQYNKDASEVWCPKKEFKCLIEFNQTFKIFFSEHLVESCPKKIENRNRNIRTCVSLQQKSLSITSVLFFFCPQDTIGVSEI